MPAPIEPDLKLEIAHVLTIDIVAYSTLLIDEQSRVVRELNLIVRNSRCFREAESAGRLTSLPTGDGMALVFFGDAEAPLECAMQISEALKSTPELRVRMGVHSGPINQVLDVNDRKNVTGAGIDLAQRVMDCGDAGHILLSKRVAEDLAAYPKWHRHLHELGEVEVKHGRKIEVFNFYTDSLGNDEIPGRFKSNVSSTDAAGRITKTRRFRRSAIVALGLVIVVSIGLFIFLSRSRATSPAQIKRIAVLPFASRSDEQSNAFFADGIQDEILTRLSKISELKVIARTSTQHYKSSPDTVRDIGRQLNVTYVLEGSVQKSGDSVRVNVQLIDARTDAHVWADTFDRKLTDIFKVESDVAKAICEQLQAHLSDSEEQLLAAKLTDSADAYNAYLRAVAYTVQPATTPADTVAAQKFLREALRLDPKFAVAWALLSYVDSISYLSLDVQRTDSLREEARQAAETAYQLKPRLGEVLHAKGFYYYACIKDYDTAVRYFEEARRTLPSSSLIPRGLAYVARRQGRWQQSEVYFNEAEELDPLNVKLLTQHAFSYIHLRDFARAEEKLNRVLERVPGDIDTLALKGAIAQAEGDLARAADLLSPLNPADGDVAALEQQVYQSIIERETVLSVRRLREVVAHHDAGLGYVNSELQFWLGWAQFAGGDFNGAHQTWEEARKELQAYAQAQPQNYLVLVNLAFIEASLGNKDEAVLICDRITENDAIQEDAVAGQVGVETLARVAAIAGDAEHAIPKLERLLATPHEGVIAYGVPLTPAILRYDPMFDRLRGNKSFDKLAESH